MRKMIQQAIPGLKNEPPIHSTRRMRKMKNLKWVNFQTLRIIALLVALIAVSVVLVPADTDNNGLAGPQITVRFAPSPGTLTDYDRDVLIGALGFRIDSFPEPVPPRGYVFVGWFAGGSELHAPIAMLRNTTIMAAYAPIPDPESTVRFAIVYDPGPGRLPQGVSPMQSFTYGSPLTGLPVPYHAGHSFSGWLWNDEPVVAPFIIRSDMVLEAAWAPASSLPPAQPAMLPIPEFHFVAAFNPFPGTFNGEETGLRFGRSGSTVRDMPPNPTRQGAIFDGWRMPNGSPVNDPLIIRNDIMLTAIWVSATESGAAPTSSTAVIETRPNPQTSPLVVSLVIFGAVIFLGLAAFVIFRLCTRQAAEVGKYRAAMTRYVREIRILIKNR